MWFFGAGISRTAGMPTATDIIWDLKFKHYCIEENQKYDSHDTNNEIIRNKVQSYMDSRGYPKLWSPEEYSFYFELTFGDNYAEQQKYLIDKLGEEKISLNIGHRALAGLIELNIARIIFTTNFDNVIEKAYAQVSNKSISPYHLEGSYAALEALNQERFPIYAKIHGDFRYQSIKNLSIDLKSNDSEMQRCFIAAGNRFGIVISGYSGRDSNVMEMFYTAINQNNAFPFGIFWTVTNKKDVSNSVLEFIQNAKNKGIDAHIVETGTFDSMLSKIWKQTRVKSIELEEKVRTALASEVNIPFPEKGKEFPILRTNALPVTSIPNNCALVETVKPLSHIEIKEILKVTKSSAIINRAENVIAWGSESEIYKGLGKDMVSSISKLELINPIELITKNKSYHAFYERALVIAISSKKPFLFRNDKGFVLAVNPQTANNPIFAPLFEALKDRYGNKVSIHGQISNRQNVFWAEAVRLKLENRNNQLYLMIRPIIWIEPHLERQNNIDFIKTKIKNRYNSATHNLLNAWIRILFNAVGTEVELKGFEDSNYPYSFKINTRTAFSQR